MGETWLQLRDAGRRSHRTQNQLYRLAALGKVRTRVGSRGFLEFRVEDLDRLARERVRAEVTTGA
jgi:hypothetical protein